MSQQRFELSREVLESGELSPHLKAAEDAGYIKILPEELREEQRRSFLADHPRDADLYIFGFGSLMWNPACRFAEILPARVRGWRRRFNLWTHLGRGTGDLPGLVLGLERGGSCLGSAIRIEAPLVESESRIIWRREMLANAYIPVWVRAELPEGTVWSVSFAINSAYERYADNVPFEIQARHIGCAEGPLGTSIEYLERTVEVLVAHGQKEGEMHRLLDAARKFRPERSAGSTGVSGADGAP